MIDDERVFFCVCSVESGLGCVCCVGFGALFGCLCIRQVSCAQRRLAANKPILYQYP